MLNRFREQNVHGESSLARSVPIVLWLLWKCFIETCARLRIIQRIKSRIRVACFTYFPTSSSLQPTKRKLQTLPPATLQHDSSEEFLQFGREPPNDR